MLQHYPEMLNLVVLVDAPMLFNGLWKLAAPLLDDRVRRKIMFVKGKQADVLLRERLGQEAAEWIARETKDSNDQKKQKGNLKRYWIAPKHPGQHDARGVASYVNSEYYIKTPGDAFEEARRPPSKTREQRAFKPKEAEARVVRPTRTKSLYAGTF